MKTCDKFYKMDKESIITIWEELSEDFFALVEEHLREIRGLVERLDDRQLETQLELEKYEQERQQQEAEGKTTPITISDEEQPVVAEPTNTEQPRQEGPEGRATGPKKLGRAVAGRGRDAGTREHRGRGRSSTEPASRDWGK